MNTQNYKFSGPSWIDNRAGFSILLFVLIIVGGIFFPLLTIIICAILSPMIGSLSRACLYYYFSFILVLFFATQKPFNDIAEYLSIYHQIMNGSVDVFNYTRFGNGFEFLFLAYMKFVGYLSSGNDQIFLLVTYTCIAVLLCKLVNDIDHRFKLLFLALFFVNLGFVEVTSYFLRQILSVLLFLYGIKKKGATKWIIITCSIFIHVSSIINVMLYVLYRVLNNKKISKLSLIVVGTMAVCGLILFIYISAYFSILEVKFSNIANNENFQTLPLNYILLTTLNLLVILVARKLSNESRGFSSFLLTKEVIFFFLLLPFPAMSNRLGMIIFALSPYFIHGFMKSDVVSYRTRYKFCLIILSFNLAAFLYLMYNVSNGSNLYSFLDGHPLTSGLFNIINYVITALDNGLNYINEGN